MKEAFYFSHDYTARNDQKILTLRWDFWLEWYALYFMMLESMAEESDWYIHRVAIGGLWVSYGVAKDKLLAFIEKCIEIEIFIEDERGIFSKRMIEHKWYRKALSDQGKAGADKRWNNSPPISPPNAKERKGKEKKEIDTTLIFQDHIKTDTESITSLTIKYFLLLWWIPAKDETVDTFRNWIKETFEANGIKDPNKMKYPLDTWYMYWKEQKKSKNLKNTFATTIKFSLPKN